MYLEIEGAERYRAALYIRLSREDETDGPSESVSNQRAMLEDFARQRGVPVAGLYVDGSSIVGLSQKELEKQAFFDLVQLFFHFTTLTKERMWNMGNLIAVTNFKGGVGKTTTTLNLGAALSAAGKRVLLVDNDPQGNLTAALGYTPPEQKHTLATLLLAAIDYPEDLDIHIGRAILHSETGVDLIGANRRLADAAARLQIMQMSQYNAVGDAECSCETVMATLLLPLRSAYDYIIIDCGLKHELLTVNALTAADYCIIPVQSHFLASEGIPDVLDMVRSVQAKFNPQLKIAGILLTMYQSRPQLCQSVRSGVSEVYGEQFHVFERPIEYSIKVAECPAAGQSILSYAPKNAAAESYRSLAREVLHLG
ncbi:AAA family ATPase [Flavonifractor plautii]|uniref:AAA family ATPase n=1 Tax=Flavonifractor plautii TaxID=292800 RepID=UPI001D00990E|nr:AAA family ATPase [Flavonifractor plautii]MCB5779732.1 AAA family ATPase [Flavonifractor plautii]